MIKIEKIKRLSIIIFVVIISGFFGYRFGLSQSGQFLKSIVEPGSMVTEASYIIFTDGSTVYARNGLTGEIEFSGIDASTVIQSAINGLTDAPHLNLKGGLIYFHPAFYYIDTPITINGTSLYDGIRFVGANSISTQLRPTGNFPVFLLFNIGHELNFENLGFWINSSLDASYTTYMIDSSIGAEWVSFDNCWFGRGNAIRIVGSQLKINNCIFEGVHKSINITSYATANTGIYDISHNTFTKLPVDAVCIHLMSGNITKPWYVQYAVIGDNEFYTETSDANATGLLLYYVRRSKVHDNLFANIHYPIRENTGSDINQIYNNYFYGDTGDTAISKTGANTELYGNKGYTWVINHYELNYTDENSGTASYTGSSTSFTVSHGLARTPKIVTVTPQQSGQGNVWVTDKNAATFTINFDNQPDTSTWYFDWYAEV